MLSIVPDGHFFALADSAENPFGSVAAGSVNADANLGTSAEWMSNGEHLKAHQCDLTWN